MIVSSDEQTIQPFLSSFHIPLPNSHKGQNGKVLVIGGSSLFHAASLWTAQTASHFVDMVHYASTAENNAVILMMKEEFHNGIVISRKYIDEYAKEDDVVIVGPGLMRGTTGEASYTKDIVQHLIETFPEKQYVFDAGALQMLDIQKIELLKKSPILTPHQKEFDTVFGISLQSESLEKKEEIVSQMALKHKSIIVMKAVDDTISDGVKTVSVRGGNAGLTKGGTGDVLAGLIGSFVTTNDSFMSCVLSSWFLKTTADKLYLKSGYWYNTTDIVTALPSTVRDAV